jgi:uncharacterized protein
MTSPDTRIPSLDVLRGFAVMGIVLMNIIGFAMPAAAYFNPRAWGGMSVADIAAWFAAFVLVDGKMRGLFSLLYGASMLLLVDRAELAGRHGMREQAVRSAWLFVFGAAHFLLLWWGDILMPYAVIGLVALPFIHRAPLDLVKWAFAAFLLHGLILLWWMAAIWWTASAAAAPGASADLARSYSELAAMLGAPGGPEIAKEVALYRSGFGAILAYKLSDFAAHGWMLLYFAFDTLGFMLLGMAMLKSGFLTGQWDADQYRRTARHCLLIGLPPMIALGLWALLSGFATVATFGIVFAWSFPFRIPLTVGYAALILILLRATSLLWLTRRAAAAGRMAFTNYLGTSLIMCFVFYGWGLGLFGHVSRVSAYLFALPACVLMLLWSKPWLDRFAYGPLEWLWRSLTRGALQPMRRAIVRQSQQ